MNSTVIKLKYITPLFSWNFIPESNHTKGQECGAKRKSSGGFFQGIKHVMFPATC